MSSYGTNPFSPIVREAPRAILFLCVAFLLAWFVYSASPAAAFWTHAELSLPGIRSFKIWQLVSYQFLHSPVTPWHLFFNGLNLIIFGPALERRWGTPGFLRFFFTCGVAGGLLFVLVAFALGDSNPVVGASGAILGLLMAWAVIWPTQEFTVFFVLRVQVRYLVLSIIILDLMMAWLRTMGGSATGFVAHLGGAAMGWLYLAHGHRLRVRSRWERPRPLARMKQWWRRRRMNVVDQDFDKWLDRRDDDFKH